MSDAFEQWVRDGLGPDRETATPSGACPSSLELCRLAAGELARVQAARVASHVADCPACAEGLMIASDLAPAPSPPRAVAGRTAAIAAIAAGLALVALGAPDRLEPVPNSGSTTRRGTTSSLEPTSPPVMPRESLVLSWSPGSPDDRYDVVVMTDALDLLVSERGLDAPRLEVSPDALEDLPAGATLLWKVTRRTSRGETTSCPTWKVELGR